MLLLYSLWHSFQNLQKFIQNQFSCLELLWKKYIFKKIDFLKKANVKKGVVE